MVKNSNVKEKVAILSDNNTTSNFDLFVSEDEKFIPNRNLFESIGIGTLETHREIYETHSGEFFKRITTKNK